MTRILYDLAAADPDIRFSPYCWRVRMALAHKGLSVETLPWRFTEKAAIGFSGQPLVPVLRDGGQAIHDSWAIAEYLDAAYSDQAPLFPGVQGRSLADFIRHWQQAILTPIVISLILMDIHAAIAPEDKDYFRTSREARFGRPMEEVVVAPEQARATLKAALAPARLVLAGQDFLHGPQPAFGDYCLFGMFQWARTISPKTLLDDDDPVFAWRERMLDLFGGLARQAKTV